MQKISAVRNLSGEEVEKTISSEKSNLKSEPMLHEFNAAKKNKGNKNKHANAFDETFFFVTGILKSWNRYLQTFGVKGEINEKSSNS